MLFNNADRINGLDIDVELIYVIAINNRASEALELARFITSETGFVTMHGAIDDFKQNLRNCRGLRGLPPYPDLVWIMTGTFNKASDDSEVKKTRSLISYIWMAYSLIGKHPPILILCIKGEDERYARSKYYDDIHKVAVLDEILCPGGVAAVIKEAWGKSHSLADQDRASAAGCQ